MLYLADDLHRKQMTINLRDEAGEVLLRRQVRARGEEPHKFLAEVQRRSGGEGYLQAGGQKLGEKKTWLHDDYVKSLRYAQWRIESTGCGIAAFVTNHGYLTNATFRLMRQQLLH